MQGCIGKGYPECRQMNIPACASCRHTSIIYTCNIYINKEELKMVGRDILACAQTNRHETFTALWNPYRRVSSRGRRAKIRFGRGARGEKPENARPPFWFYGESIRTSVFNNTSLHNTSVLHGLPRQRRQCRSGGRCCRVRLMRNCIEVTIATGHCKGSDVFLPRIPLIPSDANMPLNSRG